jgi:hypothetical protein
MIDSKRSGNSSSRSKVRGIKPAVIEDGRLTIENNDPLSSLLAGHYRLLIFLS